MITYFITQDHCLKEFSKDQEDVVWLHVEEPSKQEIQQISTDYQLPSDYLTAVLDDAENSRSEGLDQSDFLRPVLLLLQFPYVSTSPSGYVQFNTYPLSLIITPDKRLISVSNYHPPFFKDLVATPLPENDMSSRVNLVLEILWKLVLSYNANLKAIRDQVEQLEGEIQVSTENKHLYQIMDIQKSLVLFEAATTSNWKTLKKISLTEQFKHHHAYRNHLHDILVETEQSMTSAKINLKLVSQMTDTFSAIVSNNLNNVMKILTSLTIVLTIPTIIGGLYGMNVKLPIADRDDAFIWIVIGTIVLCYVTIRFLRKKNLL